MDPVTFAIIWGTVGSILASAVIYGSIRIAKLIRQLNRIIFGGTLIVVGPEYSGKTALSRIFIEGKYPTKDEEIEHTVGINETRAILIRGGKNLSASVSSLSDFSGQMGVNSHSFAPKDRTSNGIIVCLQADGIGRNNRRIDTRKWIDQYASKLSSILVEGKIRNALYSMIIVITKCDLVDKKISESLKEYVHASIRSHLGQSMGSNVDNIQILCGSLIQPGGPDFVADILEALVKQLKLKQPFIR